MNGNPPDPWVLVGTFGKPVGLAGSVRVWSESELDTFFENQTPFFIWDGVGEPGEPVRIAELNRDGRSWVIRVKGRESRETVEKITNLFLVARREDLPEPSAETAYWSDLVGAEVVTRDGETVGRVRDLFEAPASTVLEIETPDRKAFLVPLTSEVDAEFQRGDSPGSANRITLHLPEGMREATTLEGTVAERPKSSKKRLRPGRGRGT